MGGKEEESVLANSAKLASLIEDSNCRSTEDVVREMGKEVGKVMAGKKIERF